MGESTATNESDRHARLLSLKLQALVRDHVSGADGGSPELTPGSFALGAALTAGSDAWVLVDPAGEEGRGLGAALVWATRGGATTLNIVADHGTGVLARRAAEFSFPIRIWHVDGRALDLAAPKHIAPALQPRAGHLRFVHDIEQAGATPLVEHGVVVGEVRGLEVCRVVDVPACVAGERHDGVDGIDARLDVGVGVHDREAFAIMHAGVPSSDALANVVASVAAVRDVSVPAHPLNRLAPERFLRWRLEQEPWLVGMASVRPAEPPVARRNLTDRVACAARGQRDDGTEVVIVCSVGIDLDVIPYAADARLASQRESGVGSPMDVARDVAMDVVVVLPPRDVVAVTQELARLLRHPVTLVPLPSG